MMKSTMKRISGVTLAILLSSGVAIADSTAERDVATLEKELKNGRYDVFILMHEHTFHEVFDVDKPSQALRDRVIQADKGFASAVGGRVAEVLGDGTRTGTIDADGLDRANKIIELCDASTRDEESLAKYRAAYDKAKKKQPLALRFAGTFEPGKGSVRGGEQIIDVPMTLAACEYKHAKRADVDSDDYPYPNIHEGDADACGEVDPKLACEESNSHTMTFYNQARFYIAHAAARRGHAVDKCKDLLKKGAREIADFRVFYKDAVKHGWKSGITYKATYDGKLTEKQVLARFDEMDKLVEDRQDGPWCRGGDDDKSSAKYDTLTVTSEEPAKISSMKSGDVKATKKKRKK